MRYFLRQLPVAHKCLFNYLPQICRKMSIDSTFAFRIDNINGLKKLDRSLFTKSIELPCLRIGATSIGRILGLRSIRKCMVTKKPGLKHVMDTVLPSEKLVVFDPVQLELVGGEKFVIDKIAGVLRPDDKSITKLRLETLRFQFDYRDWDVRSCLHAVLPSHLDFSGFSQVGHIAHLNLHEELLPYKFAIAEILLDKISSIRTVVNKLNAINNEFRFFEMELLAGEPNYITTAIEDGNKYRMDFSKVFWNSRLSNLHSWITQQFDARSVVFDVFAGIGPFVIPAVRKRNALRCYANDLNSVSIDYLRENISLNKIPADTIETFNMDGAVFIKKIIPEKLNYFAKSTLQTAENVVNNNVCAENDLSFYVVMNLPCLSVEFLRHFLGFLHDYSELRDYFDSHPFIIYCNLFIKAKEEHSRDWYKEQAAELVRDRLHLPNLEIKEIHYVRQVSVNKEQLCVVFRMPTECAFNLPPSTLNDTCNQKESNDNQNYISSASLDGNQSTNTSSINRDVSLSIRQVDVDLDVKAAKISRIM